MRGCMVSNTDLSIQTLNSYPISKENFDRVRIKIMVSRLLTLIHSFVLLFDVLFSITHNLQTIVYVHFPGCVVANSFYSKKLRGFELKLEFHGCRGFIFSDGYNLQSSVCPFSWLRGCELILLQKIERVRIKIRVSWLQVLYFQCWP